MALRANIIMIGQFVSYLVPQSPIQLLPPCGGPQTHKGAINVYHIIGCLSLWIAMYSRDKHIKSLEVNRQPKKLAVYILDI